MPCFHTISMLVLIGTCLPCVEKFNLAKKEVVITKYHPQDIEVGEKVLFRNGILQYCRRILRNIAGLLHSIILSLSEGKLLKNRDNFPI